MKSDSLYRAIKALDVGEVRYCRDALRSEFGAMAKERLALFETLLNLSSYDNSQVEKALEGRAILTNLSVEKTRLFDRVLKYVSALNESKKPSNNPLKRLREAEVFLHLGMLDEAVEVTKKGLDSALRLEELQAEVLLRELLRIAYKRMNHHDFFQLAVENEYLLETASKKLARLVRYKLINDRAFDYFRKYRVTDKSTVRKGMEELVNLPELRDIKMADSLQSQIRFYQIWNFYYASRNEPEKAIEAQTKGIALWETNQNLIAHAPDEYVAIVSNVLGKLSLVGRVDEVPAFLKKIESIKTIGKKGESEKFGAIELQYQLYYLNSGQLELALKREGQINEVLEKYGKNLRQSLSLTLLFNLGVTHLICGNSRAALVYFNRIREFGVQAHRQDIQGVSRLLRLLLLSENDDGGTFFHYLRNSKTFFREEHRIYQLEKVTLNWLAVHYQLIEFPERVKSFQKLVEALQTFVKDGMIGAEEIQIWAFAKAHQVSCKAVFEQRLHLKT